MRSMPLPNTLSQVKAPAFVEIPYDHVEIDSGVPQEVVSLDSLIVDEKTGPSRPIHPRPMLPSRVAIIGN